MSQRGPTTPTLLAQDIAEAAVCLVCLPPVAPLHPVSALVVLGCTGRRGACTHVHDNILAS